MKRRMAWIMGWAIPEAWFAPLVRRVFPEVEHVFFSSAPETAGRLLQAGPFDQVTGYSLGALLLLEEAGRLPAGTRVCLLAPVAAFSSEENLGGRVPRAQLRALIRRLARDRAAALAGFYAHAGLDVPEGLLSPAELEHLRWGLERLDAGRVANPPADWEAWCGTDDRLLDSERLSAVFPRMHAVPGATHHPLALLGAMQKEG